MSGSDFSSARPPGLSRLESLPAEVIQHTLTFIDPADLAVVSLCSRRLYAFLQNNVMLFRTLYLQRLDNPKRDANGVDPKWELQYASKKRRNSNYMKPESWNRHVQKRPSTDTYVLSSPSPDPDDIDWEDELKTLTKFLRIMKYDDAEKKVPQIEFVAQTIAKYLRSASSGGKLSKTAALLKKHFSDRTINRRTFLQRSTLFSRIDGTYNPRPLSRFDQQLIDAERLSSAKLHSLYGVPIDSAGPTRSQGTYRWASSKVYDIQNYTQESKWGPFLGDGSSNVDWEMIEAIMIIIGHNVQNVRRMRPSDSFKNLWSAPWQEAVPYSYVSKPASVHVEDDSEPFSEEELDLIARDPYGVSGTWLRVVCFLDYSEFFSFNFATPPPPNGMPRGPLEADEATRYIVMELRITRIEEPGPEEGPLPIVHFKGTSRSMHQSWEPNANSNLRGTTRMTKEGEIRWTTLSIYYGEERWRSEGIQVGGIRSARGVLGNWFDKDFDPHGPVGPTAFWKVSDDLFDNKEEIEAIAQVPAIMSLDSDNDDDDDGDDEEDDEEAEEGDGDGDVESESGVHSSPMHVASSL